MAEAAGLVLAILGAFNDAVQCYDYIQIARDYDQDFQTAVLKLDIVKLRLSRWGHVVGLDQHGPPTLPALTESQDDYRLLKAKELLQQIVHLFEDAEKTAEKLRPPSKEVKVYDSKNDMDRATSIHKKLETLSLQRFKPVNVLRRTKWALHKGKHLNQLVGNTSELVDALIKLFPTVQSPQKHLCEQDGSELASDENVQLLEPLLEELDSDLDAAVKSGIRSRDQFFNVSFAGSHNYGLQQGHFSGNQTNNFGGRP